MSEHSSSSETSGPAEAHYSPFAGIFLPLVGFLLFAIFSIFLIRHLNTIPSVDQKRVVERMEILRKLKTDETEKTGAGYGWVDSSKKIVRIPIDLAMEVVVTELQNKQIGPAYPIGGTPGAPAAAAPAPGAPPVSPAKTPKVN